MFEAGEDDAPLDLTEHAVNPVNPEKRLEEMVAEAIKQLMEEGLAEEIGDNEIESTDYGDMLCQYSIRLTTFILLKNMKPGASAQTLVGDLHK